MHKYIFCRHTNTYSYGYTNNISADPKLHKKGGQRTNTKRKIQIQRQMNGISCKCQIIS